MQQTQSWPKYYPIVLSGLIFSVLVYFLYSSGGHPLKQSEINYREGFENVVNTLSLYRSKHKSFHSWIIYLDDFTFDLQAVTKEHKQLLEKELKIYECTLYYGKHFSGFTQSTKKEIFEATKTCKRVLIQLESRSVNFEFANFLEGIMDDSSPAVKYEGTLIPAENVDIMFYLNLPSNTENAQAKARESVIGIWTDRFVQKITYFHVVEMFLLTPEFFIAVSAIVLHVANYNITAQIEYYTHIFTKILGKNAVYYYAVYLVISALVRDHFIHVDLRANDHTLILFSDDIASILGTFFFVGGVLLNLWTLKALGIKGMYNGDSFGHLMEAPVTDGPYVYFNDPQYVGTTMCLLGSAIQYQSIHGYVLTVILYIVFYISVKFVEGPHMNKIYSAKTNKSNNKKSK